MSDDKKAILIRMAKKFTKIQTPEDKGRAVSEMTAFEAGYTAGKEVEKAEQEKRKKVG